MSAQSEVDKIHTAPAPADQPLLHEIFGTNYPSSPAEVVESMDKIDLTPWFAGTRLKQNSGWLRLSFPNLEASRLFVLSLVVGEVKAAHLDPVMISDDFFSSEFLVRNRLDGDQWSYTEQPEAGSQRIESTLILGYAPSYGPERTGRYSAVVRGLVTETMPHLAAEIKDFEFK
ncbi:MAG: hypothetical protein WC841_05235 [Candidatus Shapirobacteria bacterium]|jgi:hypothetical protein